MDNFDKEKDANKSNSTDGLNSELSKNQNADNQDDVQNNSKAALDAFMSGNTQQPVRSKDNFSEPSKNRSKGKKKKRKKKKTIGGIISTILVLAIILTAAILIAKTIISFGADMLGAQWGGGSESKEIVLTIPENSSTAEIADILFENGVIKHPFFFKAFIKINDSDANFYPGEHTFRSPMSYSSIISELQLLKDTREEVKVTFKEGITLIDAANLLEEKGVCDAAEFIEQFNEQNQIGGEISGYDFDILIENNAMKFYQMEGYLFPDTYFFYIESTCKTDFDNVSYTINKIKQNFNNKISTYIDRINELDYSLDELITVASIIQAEAGNIEDMEKVSSVFFNRLESGDFPKLQSDPTTKYANKIIKENLSEENEEMLIAYDTYQGEGIPPGAICNPGIEAIKAVLYPAETDYYFFCSNINTREFYYAKTNAEHDQNLVKAGLK